MKYKVSLAHSAFQSSTTDMKKRIETKQGVKSVLQWNFELWKSLISNSVAIGSLRAKFYTWNTRMHHERLAKVNDFDIAGSDTRQRMCGSSIWPPRLAVASWLPTGNSVWRWRAGTCIITRCISRLLRCYSKAADKKTRHLPALRLC